MLAAHGHMEKTRSKIEGRESVKAGIDRRKRQKKDRKPKLLTAVRRKSKRKRRKRQQIKTRQTKKRKKKTIAKTPGRHWKGKGK